MQCKDTSLDNTGKQHECFAVQLSIVVPNAHTVIPFPSSCTSTCESAWHCTSLYTAGIHYIEVLAYNDNLYITQIVWVSWIDSCTSVLLSIQDYSKVKKLCKKFGLATLPYSNDIQLHCIDEVLYQMYIIRSQDTS